MQNDNYTSDYSEREVGDDPAEPRKKAFTRVQMDLSPRSMQRLRVLKESLDAASYSEVIREALKLYEFLVLEDTKGTEFFIKKKGADIAPVKIFL